MLIGIVKSFTTVELEDIIDKLNKLSVNTSKRLMFSTNAWEARNKDTVVLQIVSDGVDIAKIRRNYGYILAPDNIPEIPEHLITKFIDYDNLTAELLNFIMEKKNE